MRYARIQFARDRRPIPTATLAAGALTAAALAVVGLPSPAAAQPSNSTDAFNSMTAESHPDWLAAVPDATSLAALSIPGTHDTLAIEPGIDAAAYEAEQNYGVSAATLTAQLNAGIRAIDIRVRIVNSGTAFAIHHTDVYEDANFDDVLGKSAAFLAAHPGETILLDLHGECDADTTEGGSGISWWGHCADEPSNATTSMREAIFQSYVSRYPGLFYAPTVTGSSTAAMPTLGQVRGHIVLTTFTGPRGEVYGGYGLTQLTTGNWGQYVENDYTQCGLDQKWTEAQANLAKAGADPADMYTTYTSANCAPFNAGPADVAGGYGGGVGMNQRLLAYLNAGGTAHTGVVLTDYLGHSDIDAIISRNPGANQLAASVAATKTARAGSTARRVLRLGDD
jgi:1-phosphatidylinositol phosphodiesterase